MSQLISAASGSSSAILTYDTRIPDLTQAADIVEALKLYHYGTDSFSGSSPNAKSIYSHLKTLQDNINAVLAKVSYTSGAPSSPEVGRLWVDSDTGEMYVYTGVTWSLVSAWAKASYTPTSPSAPSVGQLWVNSTTSAMSVWTGSAWVVISAGGTGTTDSFFLMGA